MGRSVNVPGQRFFVSVGFQGAGPRPLCLRSLIICSRIGNLKAGA
jgi:hypothetical protein